MGWWLDSADMVLVLGVVFSGCTACLIAFCQNMRKSRCTKVYCCCIGCSREVESDDLILAEEALENKGTPPPVQKVSAPRERSSSLDSIPEVSVRV